MKRCFGSGLRTESVFVYLWFIVIAIDCCSRWRLGCACIVVLPLLRCRCLLGVVAIVVLALPGAILLVETLQNGHSEGGQTLGPLSQRRLHSSSSSGRVAGISCLVARTVSCPASSSARCQCCCCCRCCRCR